MNEWKAAGDPLLHLFYLKVTGIQQNAPEGAFCRVIKNFRKIRKMSLIHRYQSNGYNIVLDINSGCIHLVDEVTYESRRISEEGMEVAAIAEKLMTVLRKRDGNLCN